MRTADVILENSKKLTKNDTRTERVIARTETPAAMQPSTLMKNKNNHEPRHSSRSRQQDN